MSGLRRPPATAPVPTSTVVLALALALVSGPGCNPDAADREADAPPEAGIPTLADLGARRICVGCGRPGTAPDGSFMYWTRDSTVRRLDLSRDVSGLVWRDLPGILSAFDPENASPPAVSRDGTRLAIGVNNELWIVDAESGERQMVLTGSSAGIPIDWIPGDRGLIVRNDSGLVSVSLEEGTVAVVAPPPVAAGRLSPDGRFLAYGAPGTTPAGEEAQIHIADLDGTGRGLLIDAPGFESYPVWSPDGRTLIYRSDRRGTEDAAVGSYYLDLWAVEVEDGRTVGSPRRVLQARRHNLWLTPRDMTADGRLILSRAGKLENIYAVPIDPGTLELRGEPSPLADRPELNRRSGTLSPDGSLMAFAVRGVLPGVRGWTPAIRDLAAGTDRFLEVPPDLGTDFYMPPKWSPDGELLVYTVENPDPGLVLVEPGSGDIRWLVRGEEPELIGGMGWLPESRTVVYGRTPQASGILSVREVDVDTGGERELWAGDVDIFLRYSNHLSPDGRYVTLPQSGEVWSTSLWILDLERGERFQLADSPNSHVTLEEPFLAYNAWTPKGDALISPAYVNPYDDSEPLNARPAETLLHAINVSDGSMRTLGIIPIDAGMGWWNRTRYFSFNPTGDTLVFTDGGAPEEVWVIENFDQVLERTGRTR